MPKTLSTIQDIEDLVRQFYTKALVDDQIGHFFNEHLEVPIEEHLPKIVNFWSALILNTNAYKGNAMLKHIELNKKNPLKSEDFERWLSLWKETVDEKFSGVNARKAIEKANQIAQLIKIKIDAAQSPLSLV